MDDVCKSVSLTVVTDFKPLAGVEPKKTDCFPNFKMYFYFPQTQRSLSTGGSAEKKDTLIHVVPGFPGFLDLLIRTGPLFDYPIDGRCWQSQ